MDELDCLELPSFEPYDSEDRPPPPSIDDYPLGCEVDLVDVGPARLAQTDELWEPFMDQFFGLARRTVRVVRHQGDYTFVICDQDPEMIIGCTLYRACLSEPKVRFKKYLPHSGSIKNDMPILHDGDKNHEDGALFEMYASSNEEEDRLGEAIPPVKVEHELKEAVLDIKDLVVSPIVASDKRRTGREAEAQGDGASNKVAKKVDITHYKYAYSTKKAYDALIKHHFADAVKYYTKALKYSADGGVRALSNRSVAYLGLRNAEAAYRDAMRVIELAPTSFIGYVRAGNTLRGIKKFEEARGYYEKALSTDPNNTTLKHLLASNNIAMIFASKVEHRRVASVVLDRTNMEAMLVAKRDLRAGELAWVEATTLVTVLGWPKVNMRRSSNTGTPLQPQACMQCHRPLSKIGDFSGALQGVPTALIGKMYNDPNIVQCNGHCGFMYCSETCRSKAWAAHHWVECPARGKWREAHRQIPQVIEDFVIERNNSPQNNMHVGGGDSSQLPSMMASPVNDSVDVIVACTRLACRMFCLCVSDRQNLPNAVQIFDWLHPRESSLNACLENRIAKIASQITIDKILTPVYHALRRCFTSEEEQYLTFNLFFHCYERARWNCVKIQVSMWPSIQAKAESYLGLVKNQNSRRSLGQEGKNAAAKTGQSSQSTFDAQCRALERIVSTSADSMPGYFECIGVFQLLSAAFVSNTRLRQEARGCNIMTRQCIEQCAVVHIAVVENILKGGQMVAGRTQGVPIL